MILFRVFSFYTFRATRWIVWPAQTTLGQPISLQYFSSTAAFSVVTIISSGSPQPIYTFWKKKSPIFSVVWSHDFLCHQNFGCFVNIVACYRFLIVVRLVQESWVKAADAHSCSSDFNSRTSFSLSSIRYFDNVLLLGTMHCGSASFSSFLNNSFSAMVSRASDHTMYFPAFHPWLSFPLMYLSQ